MKFSYNGFSVRRAAELDMTVEDCALLRWFVDYYTCPKTPKWVIDGDTYCWISYKYLLEDFPMIRCSTRALGQKFKRLVAQGVLVNKTFKGLLTTGEQAQRGTYSLFGFGPEYETLIDDGHTAREERPTAKEPDSPGMVNDVEVPAPREAPKMEDAEDFNRFWEAYPKKVAKQNAVRAWRKLEPSPELADEIIRKVAVFAATKKWHEDDGQFIPLPATFLNGRRWEDEIGRTRAAPGKDAIDEEMARLDREQPIDPTRYNAWR